MNVIGVQAGELELQPARTFMCLCIVKDAGVKKKSS